MLAILVTAVLVTSLIWGFGHTCPGCEQVAPTPPPPASPTAVTVRAGEPAAGNAAEGAQYARAQLARVRLPGGAHVAAPPLVMQKPPEFSWQTSQDMASAEGTVWQLPMSLAQAVAYFKRYPPAGWRLTPAAAAARVSGVVGGTVSTVLVFGRGPVPPRPVWAAQVLLSLHADGAAASFVRADVQVGWYGSRSPAEYIAGFGTMTVSGPGGDRTFTSASQIAALARLLNGLPAAPRDEWHGAATGQYDCMLHDSGYTAAFAVKPGDAQWANVTTATGDCQIAVDVWTTSPSVDDYAPQPLLVDVNGVVDSYLAQLMR